MKFKVSFFEERFIDAIGAGIYSISLRIGQEEQLIYIGESVFVLVRCATHLYEISKGKGYLGFKKDFLDREDITLVFRLMDLEQEKSKRVSKETIYVKELEPAMQSGIKDRVKPVEDMISEMTHLLEQ